MFPWFPPNNDRISCYNGQIISGSFSVGAPVKPVDEESRADNKYCAGEDRNNDRENR